MPHCRLFFHCVWTTKNRQQWIIPEIKPNLFSAIRSKTIGLGARVYALNASRDHIHLVVSLPPTLSISKFIGQVKGISSFRINQLGIFPEPVHWQEEYSVLSLSERGLPACIAYVENQKTHHPDTLEMCMNMKDE
jgi:putative transposase